MRIAGSVAASLSAGLLAGCLSAAPHGDHGHAHERESAAPGAVINDHVQGRGADKDQWWHTLPRPEWAQYERVQQDQDWFEVYRVAEGVFAIYEPGQFEEVISFLIVGDDRALLFDTGLGIGDMRRVVAQITKLDVVVLNSHTHYDHIGGNHQFDTIYARDTDYTRGRAAGSDTEAVAEYLQEGWVWKALPAGFDAAAFRSRPFVVSRTVDDGDVIDLGGRHIEVLSTPGHAPDAVCLLDREHRLLFSGDSFYLAPLYAHLEGSDFDLYAASAGRMASLADSVDAVLTSHNVPVVAPAYLVALDQAFASIRDGSASDYVVSDGFREYRFDGFTIMVDPD